ncbi:MAG: clostripain-related cysteine peptidase [Caldilinea sp.]
MCSLNRVLAALAAAVLAMSALVPANAAPPPQEDEREWLVMLYQNADDEVLEQDIFIDLNEAERVGSSDAVTIVSQLDRYEGGFDGDGDWTTARRFLVTQDDDLSALASEEIEDLGEIDSGAPETLVDFAVWAMTTYPARKYALILSDHGAGWVGGWNDDAPDDGSSLTINEIDQALAEILAETGVAYFDLVGFDACLMSQVEALAGVAPYARYAVASQETEPAIGWAYAEPLGSLENKPGQSGRELAKTIVASYIAEDVRIQDDEARSDYVLDVYGTEEAVDPDELAELESQSVTLTAVDLTRFPALIEALNEFAYALTEVDPEAIARARTYAQTFESVFGEELPSPYLDLGNFVGLVAELAQSKELTAAARTLNRAYVAAILAEKHGPGRPGASGFSIFFPVPELLTAVGTELSELSYTGYASRFAGASLWDDFLVFHYTNQDVDPDAVEPELLDAENAAEFDLADYAVPMLETAPEMTSPGIDTELSMEPLEVSQDEITAGESTLLSTQISGENVGYVYIEVSRYDEESEAYVVEDLDYIAAEETVEFDGIYYPAWSAEDLEEFIFEWEPTLYSLSDGETEAFALLEPAVYGASDQEGEYDVRGIYTFADSGQERYAILKFNGLLDYKGMLAFTGAEGTGAPRALLPQAGDTFTILEQWYQLDEEGEWKIGEYTGDTLTFGSKPFTVNAYESYPGEYSLGILVSDLLDNTIAEYATVYVREE